MKDEFFLELTNINGNVVFIKGSSIVGILQKSNQTNIFVQGDTIPFEVQEEARHVMDLVSHHHKG